MIKIEKEIPLPKPKGSKYPFVDMEVGDSFFVSCSKKDSNRCRISINNSRTLFRRKNKDLKFILRSVKGGYRCWRIE